MVSLAPHSPQCTLSSFPVPISSGSVSFLSSFLLAPSAAPLLLATVPLLQAVISHLAEELASQSKRDPCWGLGSGPTYLSPLTPPLSCLQRAADPGIAGSGDSSVGRLPCLSCGPSTNVKTGQDHVHLLPKHLRDAEAGRSLGFSFYQPSS